jgi:radical SAM protein with 4Fe4S-binding SPASM domain
MKESKYNELDFIFKDIQIKLEALFISVTNKCNLNCMHCGPDSHSKNKHLIKKEDFISLIRQFRKMGGKVVSFTGGEPFTRKDFLEIVKYTIDHKLKIIIETNGLLINSEITNRLAAFRKSIRFCISIDGFSSYSNDWFRRKQAAFESVMKNLELLETAGISYVVTTVMHNRNRDEIEEMTEYFVFKKHIMHRLVPYISRFGRGASEETRLIALNNREVMKFLHEIYLPLYIRAKQQGLEKLMFIDLPRAILPEDIDIFSVCGWGFTMAGINPDGQLGICHRANNGSALVIQESILGNNFKLSDYWFGHQLFRELRDIDEKNIKGVCSNCKYNAYCKGHCRLAAFTAYKDMHAPYPVCQELYEEGLFPIGSLIDKTKDSSWSNATISAN